CVQARWNERSHVS
ncbi:hypothetical protein V3C99_005546, partial [Haemonchus contortus]